MKIIVQFLKLWLWLLAFMTLLPIDCLAQTNYELVIEMRDGTKRFAPIPKEYDNLYDLPHIMTYPDEEGNTRGEFQVNWKEGENYGQIKVLTKDVHLIYTREAKSVTVTAKDYSIYQGDQIPEFDYWTSGVELIGKPELTCEATSDSPVGKYPIKVSRGTVENEDVVFVDGWLYIQERDTPPTSVQVTPDDQEMVYGDPVPELTYKVEGGTLSGTPEISCEATSTSPIGSYPIIASKGSVTTDDVIYNTAYLSINSAPLTITAKSYTIKQGEPMPTFEAEYAGFKNNETPAILSELPQIEPIDAERWVQIADTDTPGEYTLLIHGLTIDGNYEIEYINGKLTIEEPDFIPGDANSDGNVNVTDIVEIVNYILGHPSAKFNKVAADVNGDGVVNVTDIVSVVNIILSSNARELTNRAAATNNLKLSGGSIKLRNAENYTAAQFDIHLTDGSTVNYLSLNSASDHQMTWKMVDANTYRVVVYSMTNAAFRANSDNLFTVFMTGVQDATISNELLIKAEGTTGIDAIRTEAENGNVYDLNGRQVKTPGKGVYIIKTDNKTIKMTRK